MDAHTMNLMTLDALKASEPIDFDASHLPLMMTRGEVAALAGMSQRMIAKLELDGRLNALQRGLHGVKFYRTDEVLAMIGYKSIRKNKK